jgi:hypothetical protein
MVMEIGDKVSFVNEKQDGVIVSIKTNGMMVVEIEDGFTVDVTVKELVKIQSVQKKPETTSTPASSNKVEEKPILINFEKELHLTDQLAIVIVPDTGKVLSGGMHYHFVNGTENEILFSFSLIKGKFVEGIFANHINSFAQTEIGVLSREQLIDAEKILIEAIVFRKGSHGRFARINKELAIQFPNLVQHYPNLQAPWCFAIVEQLQNLSSTESTEDLKSLMEKYMNEPVQKNRSKPAQIINSSTKVDHTLQKHGLAPSLLEVDLHIEEIIENPGGLSNSEMMNIQLNHFRKNLDRALLSRSSSIVFIHGVGNGKLKQAIRHELQTLDINFRDASYEKYGIGATEVNLR